MKKWLEEMERIKQDKDPMLDRECIGIDDCSVIFLDNYERVNLSSNYFQSKNSIFDPTWAGCYVVPGKICTLRDIHLHALRCHARERIINYWYENGYYKSNCDYVTEDFKEKCKQFGLEYLLK